MIPAYRSMDSYPFHRKQIPFPHYYHPAMEPVPPQMAKSPFPYEQPWPCASSYAPHFCYGYNNFPGYNGHIPSYSYDPHVPSPPAMFYSGGGPSFFGPYSPQSHYSMEVPRYEYDKYMPKNHHCCGCPNHSCNQKEDKTVKIEEQKPNFGKKENDAMEFRNFPYPLVWIPPEYYGNRQMKMPTGVDEQDKMAHEKKLTGAEDFNAGVQPAVEPRLWNGWLPFDGKSVPNMFCGGDGIGSIQKETDDNVREYGNAKMDQKHQSEQQKRSEFPFPFIWFPSYSNQQEGGRTNDQKSYSTREGVEEVPHTFKFFPVKSCADEDVTKKTTSNDVESRDRSAFDVIEKVKNNCKESEKREMNVPEESVIKKDSHSVSKQRSTSPTKGSKLPPVCLRVDPLPRKKNGNENSRSPSPPASKERSKAIACETNNTPLDSMTDKTEPCSTIQNVPKASEEVAPKVKTIQVSQNKTNENMTANTAIHESGKKERRVLSDVDAAVLIQTVYRGYLVRKSEPLKKLRQIAEVNKEVTYVKDRIEAFEGSSNLQIDGKEKLAIGETIMSLLLKLDTIQGLYPSLREIRKSLARELVTLQEKLDSMTVKNPPLQQMQDLDAKEPVEVSPLSVQNGEHNQHQQEEKMTSPKDSSEGISDGKPQDQFCMKDVNGVSESRPHVGPGSNEKTKATVDTLDSTSNFSDSASERLDSDMCEMKELPLGVLNEDAATSEETNTAENELLVGVLDEDAATSEETNTAKSELPMEILDEDADNELPVGVLDEDAATSEETNIAENELPVGVLDEDAATSEETNIAENEVFIKELPLELLDENAEKSEVERSEYKEKDTDLEQPLVEEKEGVQSSEESDDWVKIDFQKQDDELKVDAPVKIEESGEEIENVTELPSLGNEEANDVANNTLNENEPKEKLAQQETNVDVQETVAGETITCDDKNTETLAKEETEPSVDLSVTKHNAELNDNMMLLEENEKLRKLMKELLEAGNEQLSVISNLTGRVKDLEKKLAKTRKSKKVKTKRHRSVTPKVSCDNSSE